MSSLFLKLFCGEPVLLRIYPNVCCHILYDKSLFYIPANLIPCQSYTICHFLILFYYFIRFIIISCSFRFTIPFCTCRIEISSCAFIFFKNTLSCSAYKVLSIWWTNTNHTLHIWTYMYFRILLTINLLLLLVILLLVILFMLILLICLFGDKMKSNLFSIFFMVCCRFFHCFYCDAISVSQIYRVQTLTWYKFCEI